MAAISDISTSVSRSGFGQDPMCQTFFVVGSPVTLSSVGLYFYAKDSILPFFTEIRKVVNGVPSQTVIPFSRVTVFPSAITTSDDSTQETVIYFDGLVYLQPGEYCIVLNSNSSNYRVWIAQIGEIDINTSQPIVSQPYVGKLFKSQNASTWVPSENQDLKFNLYKAKFTTTNSGTVDLKIESKHYENSFMESNPLISYPNSKTLKVLHPNHGLTTGSYAKISGFKSVIFQANGFSNIFGVNVATIENVEFPVSNIKQNSYTITLPQTSNVTSITRDGGTTLAAQKDLRFDAVFPQIVSLDFGGGTIDVEGRFTSVGYSLDGFVSINKNKVMNKEQAKDALIEVLMNQVMDLTMMSKIELGDDVIEEIKRLQDIINK